ncbi:MAG: hypothetical protein LBL75_00025 [Rickettsiales bacterium]|jgi:hypothetical protein|nr:hypothetical protein [Rickettsiales bacterium]
MKKVFLLFVCSLFAVNGVFAASTPRAVSRDARVESSESNNAGRNNSARVANVNRAATEQSNQNVRNPSASPRNVGARAARTENTNTTSRAKNVSVRPTMSVDTQTNARTSTATRGIANRAATTDAATATASLTDAAAINDTCMTQYTDCMDQFCAVIDANQKRCACSSHLESYARVESAVKDANTQLNDVAQRIRYVGLSADEIRSIMTETEAEQALSTVTDNTESRNMLEQIESLIRTPDVASASSSSVGSGLLDVDITFDGTADVADMFNLTDTGTATSFSGLRGTDLYNSAQKRCQPILTSCKNQGANTAQITARYDIEVDKDCITYEQGLNKMNDTLKSNVRSATNMLQKARLSVLQNKNEYDARGCIGALETCMKDDMVCGSSYTKCLDPTKKYIDENGGVVLGQDISKIRDMMAGYDNSAIDKSFISGAWGMSGMQSCDTTNNDGKCLVKYLLGKIGMDSAVTSGLCRPVLDKCQAFTRDTRGKYEPANSIVVGYVSRAMTNIRSAQEKIISDYASNCMADIATCYSKQVTQINAWSSNANANNVYAVLKGACRNVALTCAYAVFASDADACPEGDTNTCIESISDIFYQSMLCPDYSTWMPSVSGAGAGVMYPIGGTATNVYVNERCVCQSGYGVYSGACQQCPTGTSFQAECTGVNSRCPIIGCGCASGQTYDSSSGTCHSISAQTAE